MPGYVGVTRRAIISAVRDAADSEDLVLWISRKVCDALPPGVEWTNALIKVEQAARLHWGGRRAYVRKTMHQDAHTGTIALQKISG